MPVLLYFLLLCKSSKERCPRPLFGAKASAKVRTSPETAKHFRDIFSIFFPENTGIYPLQPEKSTPHGKNSPPGLQNGPLAVQAQWHILKEIIRNYSEIYGDFFARTLFILYMSAVVVWPRGGKNEGVKHVILVAGTAGPMNSMQLKSA